MTAPATTPSLLDFLIDSLRDARVALLGARAAFEHCPSSDRQAGLDAAQAHLDGLLDAYLDVQ